MHSMQELTPPDDSQPWQIGRAHLAQIVTTRASSQTRHSSTLVLDASIDEHRVHGLETVDGEAHR